MSNKHFEDVKDFMNIFGQSVLTKKTIPSTKLGNLRLELIKEESIVELNEAIDADDLVGIADALADTLYVVYGAYAAFGLKPSTWIENFNNKDPKELELKLLKINEAQRIKTEFQTNFDNLTIVLKTGLMNEVRRELDNIIIEVHSTAIKCGIDIFTCFDEVHSSNMSKVCKTLDEAKETIEYRLNVECNKNYQDAWIDEVQGYFIVKRALDNKVLKGINYFEPNLAAILGL